MPADGEGSHVYTPTAARCEDFPTRRTLTPCGYGFISRREGYVCNIAEINLSAIVWGTALCGA